MAISPQSTADILTSKLADKRQQYEQSLLQAPQVLPQQANLVASNPYSMFTTGLQTAVNAIGAGDRREIQQANIDREFGANQLREAQKQAQVSQQQAQKQGITEDKAKREATLFANTQEDRRATIANQRALVEAQQKTLDVNNMAEAVKQRMYQEEGVAPNDPIVQHVNDINTYYSTIAQEGGKGNKGVVSDFVADKEDLNNAGSRQNLTQSLNDTRAMVVKAYPDVSPALLDYALRTSLHTEEVDPVGYVSAGGDLDSTGMAERVKNILPTLIKADILANKTRGIDNEAKQELAAIQLQAARAGIPKQ